MVATVWFILCGSVAFLNFPNQPGQMCALACAKRNVAENKIIPALRATEWLLSRISRSRSQIRKRLFTRVTVVFWHRIQHFTLLSSWETPCRRFTGMFNVTVFDLKAMHTVRSAARHSRPSLAVPEALSWISGDLRLKQNLARGCNIIWFVLFSVFLKSSITIETH